MSTHIVMMEQRGLVNSADPDQTAPIGVYFETNSYGTVMFYVSAIEAIQKAVKNTSEYFEN